MDELEELDRINDCTNTDDIHTDQTNQYDIHLECSLHLSTETPIVDIHRECALPFHTLFQVPKTFKFLKVTTIQRGGVR